MKKEAGLPFPFFTKEAGTEGRGCFQGEEQAHRKRGTKAERPAKNGRAGVALISEGFGSETARNGLGRKRAPPE